MIYCHMSIRLAKLKVSDGWEGGSRGKGVELSLRIDAIGVMTAEACQTWKAGAGIRAQGTGF